MIGTVGMVGTDATTEGQEQGATETWSREGTTRQPSSSDNGARGRMKAKMRRVLDAVLRNASILAMVLYLTGSLGGLLALTTAGRHGGLDEKAFQLSVASPQLGATKAADIMRLYHARKDFSTQSTLTDAQAMWNECDTQWHPSAGRRHRLTWYRGGEGVVYDVIEATRSDSMESVLVVIPYRPGLASSSMGMAVGHGLGWYLQEQEWLAKNVIIAYVDVPVSSPDFTIGHSLDAFLSTVVDRRIGRIVQAVILDVSGGTTTATTDTGPITPSASIKVHGWNGRLPNLDLFIATRQLAESHHSSRERITVHGASTAKDSAWSKCRALMRFVTHHGLGIADGGHGALLDRGIDALTVELSFETTNANLIRVLQMTEGLVRGLNNLHERLHHATGLYALGGAGVVIDIGMYTVCPVLLALACALKAHQLASADRGIGMIYITWNESVRWTAGLVCGATALYVNSHVLARHVTLEGTSQPSMDALGSCVVAFGRICVLGFVVSEFFTVRGEENDGNNGNSGTEEKGHGNLVRWDATVAWALCGASIVLILYRWSLAWIVLTLFLPLILTKD